MKGYALKKHITLFSLALLLFATTPAPSNDWNLDKAHSGISFTIQHMVISEVTGRFNDFRITFSSSKEDFTDGMIDAVIEVKSIDTGNERRDSHLRTDDFFNAEQFPVIRFRSTGFVKVNDRSYTIKGLLTIRDTTKEVTVDASLNGIISSSRGIRSGWKAVFAINRFEYGLKWNKTIETGGLVAGEMVTISLDVEFVK